MLGDDVRTLWDRPNAPVQLKKRILRTVLNEIIVQSERESPTHRLILTGLKVFTPSYLWSAIHQIAGAGLESRKPARRARSSVG